jgi:Domain of unknown function (DUF5916)
MSAAFRLALALIASTPVYAIEVDGKLDEADWAQAQRLTDFYVTEPLTREPAEWPTELLILPRPDALYVGMRATHPPSERIHGHSQRDASTMDADPAILFIDFEGLGKTAYEFTYSISGAKRDSIVLNQTDVSNDWDGDWIAAVSEKTEGWSVEWRIPWSIAPEGAVHGDSRTIGVYASRFLKKANRRLAMPAIEILGANFVRDFRHVEVPRYSTASLDWYPYVSFSHDELRKASRGHAGLDVFWKPNGRNQVSVALNPDFGQVESDNVVVNYSAIETFFSEKRPFFTQGQQLFDLRTTENGRLVNTRRIGAAPDVGPEGVSNVAAAAKYTGLHGDQEYGVFGAVEENSSEADGRRFLVARWHYAPDTFGVGYLGTLTQHPSLNRDAAVHALDFNFRSGPGIAWTGQALMSDIRERPNAVNSATTLDSRGYGGWLRFDYQPGGRWQHTLRATYFDRRLDFNDLGYQERSGLVQLRTETWWFTRQYRSSSIADNGNWYLGIAVPYNDRGARLAATTELGHQFQWRNGSSSYFYYYHYWSGIDDLTSRGHGDFVWPTGHNFNAEYTSKATGMLRYFAAIRLREEGLSRYTRRVEFKPILFLTDNFSVAAEFNYSVSPDWLIWVHDNVLGSYRRNELDSLLNISWYPTARQELRLKLQWIALSARPRQLYAIGTDRGLTPIAATGDDFTLSTIGMQLRYRFEFKPLSELYIVYSRGGDGSLGDQTEGFGDQLRRALNRKTANQFFVKLRYRFGT